MTIEEIEDKYFRGFNCGDLVESLLAIAKRQREALEKIANWNDGIQADISDCPERIAKQALEG